MNYRIVHPDELYHHGVKGMKWGVRKVNYNTPGMRSKSIYDRLDELENQEIEAHSANRSNFRAAKRQVKSEARARVREAKAANKEARKTHDKSTAISAKKNLKEVKKTAKADVKAGKSAARDIYNKNGDTITRNFDKAYHKTIGESYIKSAKKTNAALEIADIMLDKHLGIDHDNSRYQDRKLQLEEAEYRRNRYAESRRG